MIIFPLVRVPVVEAVRIVVDAAVEAVDLGAVTEISAERIVLLFVRVTLADVALQPVESDERHQIAVLAKVESHRGASLLLLSPFLF